MPDNLRALLVPIYLISRVVFLMLASSGEETNGICVTDQLLANSVNKYSKRLFVVSAIFTSHESVGEF